MPGLTPRCALAAIAMAAALGLALTAAPTAAATPSGPCAELLYVGVCAPASEHPSPPPGQSLGEVVVPDSSGMNGISAIN